MKTGQYGRSGTLQFVCLSSISEIAQTYLKSKEVTFRMIDSHTSFLLLRHNGQLGDIQFNEDGDITVFSTGVVLRVRNGQAMSLEER